MNFSILPVMLEIWTGKSHFLCKIQYLSNLYVLVETKNPRRERGGDS
jgi:hypothetical protein